MGFLDKLLGKKQAESGGDPHGIYFYVQCDHCGERLRVRADKRHDLQRDYDTNRWTWKKEIMDARCFRIMVARVVFDPGYRILSQEIEGQGHFISEPEYLAGTGGGADEQPVA